MVIYPMSLTDPNPVFKVTAFLEVECRKKGASERQSYYCTIYLYT